MKIRNIVAVILLLAATLSCDTIKAKTNSSKDKKTNVVVILVDDLGWKDLGYTGSKYYESPNIDKLANQSINFTNGYAGAANCAPSRACLLSGQNTPRHGIYTVASSERGKKTTRRIIPTPNKTEFKDEMVTMAEMFKLADYKTISLGKYHVGHDPTTQGFDINVAGDHRGNPGKNGYFAPYNVKHLGDAPEGENLTDRLTTEAIKFIEGNKNDPFFVYLSFYTVHTPHATKPELMDKYEAKEKTKGQDRPVYAGMIETLDNNVGRVMETLDKLNLSENTIVVFTSDNGGIRDVSYQNPLRAGKGSYYEGGIRVPFLIKWPKYISKPKECDIPVVNLDLYPTFKELVGVDMPNKTLDGQSLLPYLKKGNGLKETPLYWHFPIYLQAYNGKEDGARDPLFRTRPGSVMRWGKWKLHEYFEDEVIELYNLDEDLGEEKNVADQNPKIVDELYKMLNDWRRDINAPVPKEKNPFFDKVIEEQMIKKALVENKSKKKKH